MKTEMPDEKYNLDQYKSLFGFIDYLNYILDTEPLKSHFNTFLGTLLPYTRMFLELSFLRLAFQFVQDTW